MLLAISVAIMVPLLLWAALRLGRTARRLDRLHKRTEAAWAVCLESCARRLVVCRALVVTHHLADEQASALISAVHAAERADREQREAAEQRVTTQLDHIDEAQRGDLAAELADAQERVALAVQFYNDAVRDTRALRESWFTRVFRLAGHAGLPEYFDVTARVAPDAVNGHRRL